MVAQSDAEIAVSQEVQTMTQTKRMSLLESENEKSLRYWEMCYIHAVRCRDYAMADIYQLKIIEYEMAVAEDRKV